MDYRWAIELTVGVSFACAGIVLFALGGGDAKDWMVVAVGCLYVVMGVVHFLSWPRRPRA
jgi:hypothetical protein